ncbi:unnamed protein product [Prorocentrum cordatum]|uniref:Uncharacterized protein n=1 Tax=Prorocentrum cordatum TaxID=2364126 RepID=A0ABN9VWT2_9DINO|nr:unnamed protein product [Polarella glacialis]
MAHSSIAAFVAAFVAGLVVCQLGNAFVAAPLGQRGLDGHTEPTTVSAAPGAAPASQSVAPVGVGLTMIGASVALALLTRGALSNAARKARPQGPAQHRVVMAAFESELGVQDPVGFWDPAGFTADGSTANFARRRQTELKHGRVSMLATMGYITPEITGKLPGYLSPSAGLKFADIPNGLGAISKVPAAGWAQIVAYGAFCELSQDQSAGTAAAAGDFGFKVLTSSDAGEKQKKLAAEIANGRLAMMAIIGMFFQDGLTGSAWGDWALYTGSPLRAFESELGVQDPVGFWDPAGFTAATSASRC